MRKEDAQQLLNFKRVKIHSLPWCIHHGFVIKSNLREDRCRYTFSDKIERKVLLIYSMLENFGNYVELHQTQYHTKVFPLSIATTTWYWPYEVIDFNPKTYENDF